MTIPKHILLIVFGIAAVAPVHGLTTDPNIPYQQEFILTAYYSPLPDQCCYVLGGEKADKQMNGEGIAGADGTPVYPGMVAAPSSYPFGTRINLPGIGIVAVHDRGGAITELSNGAHRIDVWVGYGEEGLARALAFGVQEVKGTVYPVGGRMPDERFNLENLPSPADRLEEYNVAVAGLLDVAPKKGDTGYSVVMLQDALRAAGFFPGKSTGNFDDVTVDALSAFNAAFKILEPADQLTPVSAAHLLASKALGREPRLDYVSSTSSAVRITEAKRLLRYLGYYDGRTTGEYDGALAEAILRFQQQAQLVGTKEDPGAGRIGPLTKSKLASVWRRKMVALRADQYLLYKRVTNKVLAARTLPDRFLAVGHNGPVVRSLQELLAERGYFPKEKINGTFGDLTKASVLKYQLDRKLVTSSNDPAAGYVGPSTLKRLRIEEMKEAYNLVRSEGWGVL